jgi:hypothetical protein
MRLHLGCLDSAEPENGYQPEFSPREGETYDTKRIHIDNHYYTNCRFVKCTFVYSGGPFAFDECELEGGFRLALTGSARRTALLAAIFQEYDKTIPKPLY